MKRRDFLKSGLSLGGAIVFNTLPRSSHAAFWQEDTGAISYTKGDRISEEVFVSDKDLKQHALIDLCKRGEAPVNVLYIYGGGANENTNRLGGIWCRDSFEDFHVVRFLTMKYDDSEVKVIPVACPPIYASHFYGFERRVFLDEPDDSPKFQESAKAFVASTEKVVLEEIIPVTTYYDLRHRLLFNRRQDLKPGPGYGPVYDWQGKFRSNEETQKYGTPTVWLLSSEGVVLEGPFWGNLYHSHPFTIRYTVVDVDRAVQKHL